MASDFMEQVYHSLFDGFQPPIRSLMDLDFYKLPMGQVIRNKYPDVEVEFELIVRDKSIPLTQMISERELRDSLDYAMDLVFRKTDLYYLRGMDLYERHMFREDYLSFLQGFKLPSYEIDFSKRGLKLRFKGKWADSSMWETTALGIVSDLYYRGLLRKIPRHEIEIVYSRAKDIVFRKLDRLRQHKNVRFADFGTRRRHSFLWQKYVVGLCKEMMGEQFVGTSNMWMAFHYDLPPIGTNAHELPMVLTALADSDDAKRDAQYQVLRDWEETYGQGLRIILPDTYGSAQFYAGAPEWVADWKGQRQDSGHPIEDCENYISWLQKMGRDPKKKVNIFSDGLDVSEMVTYADTFENQIQTTDGWGSLLMNDFRECLTGSVDLRPFSVVCKAVSANGRPCVKLSNNVNKATGPVEEVERYKRIFGEAGRTSETVIV